MAESNQESGKLPWRWVFLIWLGIALIMTIIQGLTFGVIFGEWTRPVAWYHILVGLIMALLIRWNQLSEPLSGAVVVGVFLTVLNVLFIGWFNPDCVQELSTYYHTFPEGSLEALRAAFLEGLIPNSEYLADTPVASAIGYFLFGYMMSSGWVALIASSACAIIPALIGWLIDEYLLQDRLF